MPGKARLAIPSGLRPGIGGQAKVLKNRKFKELPVAFSFWIVNSTYCFMR